MPLSATHCQLLHLLLVFILCRTLILIRFAVFNLLSPLIAGRVQRTLILCQSCEFKISMKILILLVVHLEEYLTTKGHVMLLLYTELGGPGDARGGDNARPTHSSMALR